MARFFVDATLAVGAETQLPAEVAHHAVRVLRLRDGVEVTEERRCLLDGPGVAPIARPPPVPAQGGFADIEVARRAGGRLCAGLRLRPRRAKVRRAEEDELPDAT